MKLKNQLSKTISLCMFIVFFIQTHSDVKAQLEASKWVFGNNVGLDFSTGAPLVFTGSKLTTTEGCASISNSKGAMLFYTDGITVWNRNNQQMPNGDSLKGDPSSTQSGVAVPMPGNPNIYYLFTIDAEAGDNGFCYSIIDITKDGGLGDVVEKNTLVKTPSTERITAVRHRNRKDFWILTHAYNSDEFMAYLLTSTGLSKNPIISAVGISHNEVDNTIGYMKISPDGSQLAVAIKEKHCFQLFDFDNETGIISHPISFQLEDGSKAYGIEFSPNGSLLYVTAGGKGKIYQVNLQAGSKEAIIASLQIIGTSSNSRWIGALQVGIDGKIYVSEYTSPKLSVINYPNLVGKQCNFVSDAVNLGSGVCQLGLPTFIQTYFNKQEINSEAKQAQIFSDKVKVEVNKRFILNSIFFDFNKSTLRANSNPELQKVVELMKKNPTNKIEISGHTDNIGNKSYNIELSKARAEEVKKYLISKGIDANRIVSIGKGSSDPIDTNDTENGRQRNRRVEFMLK